MATPGSGPLVSPSVLLYASAVASPTGSSTAAASGGPWVADSGMMGPPPSPEYLAEDISSILLWACGCHIAITAIFFACRIASRRIMRQRYELSDLLLLVGILVSDALAGIYIYSAKGTDVGRHIEYVMMNDPAAMTPVLKIIFISTYFYFTALFLIKSSIVLLYYNIFGTIYQWPLAALGIAIFGWWISFSLAFTLICRPVEASWIPSLQAAGACSNPGPVFLANGIINIATDLAMLVLPIRVVWMMQMDKRTKAGLVLVFLLGGFVCIASALRLYVSTGGDALDYTYCVVRLEMWTMIELTTAVACACLVTMRPLLAPLVPRWLAAPFSRRSRSRSSRRLGSGGRSPGGGGGAMHMGAPGAPAPGSAEKASKAVRVRDGIFLTMGSDFEKPIGAAFGGYDLPFDGAYGAGDVEERREGSGASRGDDGSLNGSSTKELFPKELMRA